MTSFNDNEYASLIGNLLHDTQYIKISNMGKVSGLRKHAEVMVRKILNIGSDTKIMLGQVRRDSNNAAINSRMEALGEELSNRLIEVVNKINPIGSAGTHTQHTEDFSDGEVEGIEDAILDLYALIFIRYFGDSQISIYYSPKVLHEFSILPPIIRYKTWSYLFKKDKNNIQVVNKLCLSIIKTFNKERAYKWLEDNSEQIKAISYPTESEIKKYIQTGGVEVKPGLYQVSLDFQKYNNIYDLLYDKIKHSKTSINESGKMYKTFEEAINHYNNFKEINIQDDSEEVAIFHSLMEFVYLGRKAKEDL
ncbi:hypothetical protein [Romboutsia sp.]|uniref:hypothetical protein n=1 Tax=Romboutsia sp. TaxID=1965302 RepID=UPI003F2E278C